MVNLLKGRKNLEKAPAFPKFTTQDDASSKFKKLVRYYNKIMDISTVDLDNILEGLEGDYQYYYNRPRIILVIKSMTLTSTKFQRMLIKMS